MAAPRYFDYISVAREARISETDLAAAERSTRLDYPQDDMLYELRLLRICMAIRDGHADIRDVLAPASDHSAPAAQNSVPQRPLELRRRG